MYVAALMECMRGPVDDMLSPSYQRLRQLIEAHVRALHWGLCDAEYKHTCEFAWVGVSERAACRQARG